MILAVTGHRPDKLGGYDVDTRLRVRKLALAALDELDPSLVITGMAQGWDTAIAAAAITLDIPFVAAIPFAGQEAVWPEGDQDLYRRLLAQASVVEYVCDPGYAAWKMLRRNAWMVDHAEHLLALWNGTEGGTANCVEYATRRRVPITNVWARYTAQEAARG